MIKDEPATIVDYAVSLGTLRQWREQKLAIYADEAFPDFVQSMNIRVVFKGPARHGGYPEAFSLGPDPSGVVAWIPMSDHGFPISGCFAVAIAARELARGMILRRGSCRELANGALLVDLGTL